MTAKSLAIGSALLALAMLGGCKEEPKEPFALDGKLFVFNYRVAMANYLVNIKTLKEIPDGLVAIAHFDDPAGGPPIEVRQKIFPAYPKTTINSPPVFCIVKDKPYKVDIRIEDAAGKLVQQLNTEMVSNQDQTVVPDKPLVMGPGYTPNDGSVAAPGVRPEKCPGA